MLTKIHIVTEAGRDKGKAFLLTEMSASKAEKWAAKLWLALARSGLNIGDEFLGSGWAGVAMLSFQALRFTKFEDLEPLMDEMFGCIEIIPDRKNIDIHRTLIEEDILEVATRIELRSEVFNLHAGPFMQGVRSKFGLAPAKKAK